MTLASPPRPVAPAAKAAARVSVAPSADTMERNAEVRFRALVGSEFEFIWRALRGLGVPAANADDAAQQVFLVAAQKLDAIVPGSERAFLFATARGIAANARRASARSREITDDEAIAARADDAPDPEALTASKRARELLERILDELDEDLRTVFVLYELEGMTMAEIAKLLGIPNGTAASRLRRAREDFQARTARLRGGER